LLREVREKERKKAVEALEKAGNFMPLDMLEAIPDPKKTTTEADIEAQLQEALVSTIAAIDPSLDDSFCYRGYGGYGGYGGYRGHSSVAG
jgi:hypothetical protein